MKPIEKEFSQGVKILLERMQNNPEDFVGTDEPPYSPPKFGMFSDLMRDILRGEKVRHWDDWHLLTKAEQSALVQGYKDMMRARFDLGIMKKLLEEPEEKPAWKISKGPLTADQITRDALKILEKEFSKTIDNGMLGAALGEPKKFLLNPSQVKMAQKMGVSPAEYARKINAPTV